MSPGESKFLAEATANMDAFVAALKVETEALRSRVEGAEAQFCALAECVETIQSQLETALRQRDTLAKAVHATRLFHSVGGLVGREDVERWRAIAGETPFTAAGLLAFVNAQLVVARLPAEGGGR